MNNYEVLIKKFNELKEDGCQVIPRNSTGDIGLYFEKWIGISNNDFSVPDFDGIEIKVKSYNSIYPINLFSLTCDGPDFFEMRRFVDKFGINDREFTQSKVLSITLSASVYTYWGKYLKMKLFIDEKKEKIFIIVANVNGRIIEKRAYWNFSSIKSVLYRKLNNLCYINAKVIYSYKNKFVWYDKINFYKLHSFERFIDLLKEGKIKISIKYGVYRHGKKKGQTYDHGTAFVLSQDNMCELFLQQDHRGFAQKNAE